MEEQLQRTLLSVSTKKKTTIKETKNKMKATKSIFYYLQCFSVFLGFAKKKVKTTKDFIDDKAINIILKNNSDGTLKVIYFIPKFKI